MSGTSSTLGLDNRMYYFKTVHGKKIRTKNPHSSSRYPGKRFTTIGNNDHACYYKKVNGKTIPVKNSVNEKYPGVNIIRLPNLLERDLLFRSIPKKREQEERTNSIKQLLQVTMPAK